MSPSPRPITLLGLAVVLVSSAGFLIAYGAASTLLDESPPAAGGPSAVATATLTSTSATPQPQHFCQPVATSDEAGDPVNPFFLNQVRVVHDAACQRDYDALAEQMDEKFNGSTPNQVIAEWRRAGAFDVRLEALAETLEVKGTLTHGGLLFCHPNGGVAVFGRGTINRPGKWTSFDISLGTTTPCQEFRLR